MCQSTTAPSTTTAPPPADGEGSSTTGASSSYPPGAASTETEAPKTAISNDAATATAVNGDGATTSAETSPCRSGGGSSLVRRTFLTINATLCVPMYTMALCTGLYSLVYLYCSPATNNNSNNTTTFGSRHSTTGSWMRTLLFLYCPLFCVLDRRPTLPPAPYMYKAQQDGEEAEPSELLPWWRHLLLYGRIPYAWTQAVRSVGIYRNLAEYFPIRLHKTVDLPVPTTTITTSSSDDDREKEDENTKTSITTTTNPPYMFLYHPHGVIGMGSNVALALNECGFDELFPGVRRYGVTLNACFYVPLFREWLLALGYISANKRTLVATLEGGNSIVLIPGGAAEAVHAHRDNFRLHLRQRRGFVRLALETGALPIPCLGFGENEAFETYYPTGSLYWQQRICKLLTFSTPVLTRFLPCRKPIHVVVGEPIRFEPSASVEDCHAQYLEAVRRLYDRNKDKYGYGALDVEFV